MSEFCPKCGQPLASSEESDRLCEVCGWFGDTAETPKVTPKGAILTENVIKALDLYRLMCRNELSAEGLAKAFPECAVSLPSIRQSMVLARQSLLEMFVTVRQPLKVCLPRINGVVPWPADWTDRHYNGLSEPCDTLVGPCCCGAWHLESETWVQEALHNHNCLIEPE